MCEMFLSCTGEIRVESATENSMNFVPWCFFLSLCSRTELVAGQNVLVLWVTQDLEDEI